MRGWIVAVALVGAAVAAQAAPRKSAVSASGERVVKSFTACRAIAAADERLACFDKAAAALESAVESKTVTILDRTDVQKTRRSLFGFTLPRFGIFGDDDEDEADEKERRAFTEINTTVASARQSGYGRYDIRLADETGAVWQTTEPLPDTPKAGSKIRIRKGTIGSYFINVDGRTVRGIRIR